jgi:regulatory protein YycI of two-component signal transduction system YycFG
MAPTNINRIAKTSQEKRRRDDFRVQGPTYVSALGYVFGALTYYKSKKSASLSDNNVEEDTVRILTPVWLSGKIYEIHKYQERWSYQVTFRSYNILPQNAMVFQCAQDGDIVGLQQLFTSKQATLYDRDIRGNTILHVG